VHRPVQPDIERNVAFGGWRWVSNAEEAPSQGPDRQGEQPDEPLCPQPNVTRSSARATQQI
jgi:hypothetical protein